MSTTAKLGRLFAAAGVAWTVVGGGPTIASAGDIGSRQQSTADVIRKATAPFESVAAYDCSDYVASYGSAGYDVFVGSGTYGSDDPYCRPDAATYVYWEFTGNVGPGETCSTSFNPSFPTQYDCLGRSIYVDGCDLEATFHIWWYSSFPFGLITDYDIPIQHGDSCD